MKIKTRELIGPALDWAVAKCENFKVYEGEGEIYVKDGMVLFRAPYQKWGYYSPSTNWAQGGPIIERDGISVRYDSKDARGAWYAVMGAYRFLSPDFEGSGPTPLVAAMRCFVASKLGVDIPEELVSC